MKIAFLTPEYPHQETGSSGGIGTSIKNLAESLVVLGHIVRILVYEQKEDTVFTDNQIIVQRIKNVKVKGLSWYFTRKKLEKIIKTLHQNQEIDIVEAADWTGITSFIAPKNCPIVIRLNGSDTYFCHLDKRPVKAINRFHEKRALQKANGHIAVSQFTATLTNTLFGLQIPFTIIPNGINPDNFKASISNQSANPSILYFGTLIRKKGLLELPLIFNEVHKKNPNITLILVGKDTSDIATGNSSTWKMMQELFDPSALQQVQYLGSVPYNEIQQKIANATVCVFPTFAEALPVSWIEAMAMEKPIVASNIGWAPEVIDDTVNGFLVDPKNHVEYAEKINILLANEALCRSFGKQARTKVLLKFKNSVIAEQSVAFYQSLIS